jgi:hypothetical protein
MRSISCAPEILERAGLGRGPTVEQVAFFLAQPLDDGLRLVDVRAMGPADFDHQSAMHVSLAEHVRPELIAWAWKRELCLVEAHTHVRGDPVCLSSTDLSGLSDWVPHVWWRLRARPYAAIVFGDETVDGIAWRRSATGAEGVAALEVDGRPPQVMTGLSLPRFSRRIDAYG